MGRGAIIARAFLAALASCGAPFSGAQDPAAAGEGPERPFKLTLGLYDYSDDSRGTDVNLRHTSALGNAWIGYFRLKDQDVSQWRGGWDRSFGERFRVQPSLQVASGGFAGASLGFETGEPYFVGAGLGRTNLRPYYNLNFDPNDSWTLSAGHRDGDGRILAVLWVRDNRENPDQRHLHFTWRQPLAGGERLTLDALLKRGLVDGGTIRRTGFTITYDWPRFFVRVAFDPNSNFTSQDAWRYSMGTRF
jgi:hypothetical protein